MIARRVTRNAALSAALLGAEPIPLLDLPLQVAVNWRMALQLAAIYGRGPLDYRSREMIGTVAWNLGLRRLMQQAIKLAPVVGWAVSAGLSGSATWLLGNSLQRYFQDEERWHEAPMTLKMALADRRQRIIERIRGWWGRSVIHALSARLQKHTNVGQFLRLRAHRLTGAQRLHPDSAAQQHTVSKDPPLDETVQSPDREAHKGPTGS
ncbi:MAG: DUF697 domain-containing protein [Anaerolineae bacterium]